MANYRLSKTGPQIDDILDNSARQNAIAIVSNGNSHIAITSGQYVYVKNHGTLTEGLYKANSNISANGTLTTSNVTAVSNGGLNELKSALTTKADMYHVTILPDSSVSVPCGSYGAVIVSGVVGNVGLKTFIIRLYEAVIGIKDLWSGSDWTSTSAFNATFSNGQLTLTAGWNSYIGVLPITSDV